MTYTHVIHILNDVQLSPGDLVFLERSDRTKRFGEVLKGAGTHIYTCTMACTWALHLRANHTHRVSSVAHHAHAGVHESVIAGCLSV